MVDDVDRDCLSVYQATWPAVSLGPAFKTRTHTSAPFTRGGRLVPAPWAISWSFVMNAAGRERREAARASRRRRGGRSVIAVVSGPPRSSDSTLAVAGVAAPANGTQRALQQPGCLRRYSGVRGGLGGGGAGAASLAVGEQPKHGPCGVWSEAAAQRWVMGPGRGAVRGEADSNCARL